MLISTVAVLQLHFALLKAFCFECCPSSGLNF
jgi:hypothetical protein|nr:MAG TPA: hypothetical protein [Caudoviricetes sp.]DAR51852.1 MAG TPA: hypothetical protein [Caudoviricetes sp.]